MRVQYTKADMRQAEIRQQRDRFLERISLTGDSLVQALGAANFHQQMEEMVGVLRACIEHVRDRLVPPVAHLYQRSVEIAEHFL